MEQICLVATQFAEFPHIADVAPVGPSDEAVLQEIRAVLAKHNALDRFGINLIHRHFDLQEGEVALESTDLESRRQTVEVVPESVVFAPGSNVIATQWVFGTKGEGMACKLYCNYSDYAHTTRHATVN
jgi:hypothetical protein